MSETDSRTIYAFLVLFQASIIYGAAYYFTASFVTAGWIALAVILGVAVAPYILNAILVGMIFLINGAMAALNKPAGSHYEQAAA